MLITEKYFEKSFVGKTAKEAYLKACKWISLNIISQKTPMDILQTSFSIDVIKEAEKPTVKVEIFCSLDEGQHRKEHCKRCKMFHSSVFHNQYYNCDKCSLKAHAQNMESKLKIKKEFRKKKLHYFLGIDEE